MPKVGSISAQGRVFDRDEVILIVLFYCSVTKPVVKFDELNCTYIRNIVKGFAAEQGAGAVDKLPPDLLVNKQDLLSACRGMF